MVSEALPGALVSQWPDEAMDLMKSRAEELQPEDAERVTEVLDRLDNPYRQRERADFGSFDDLPEELVVSPRDGVNNTEAHGRKSR